MQFIIQTCILGISGVLLCIPLMFWMYICTTFPHARISRGQFFTGMFAGVFVSLPLLFHNSSWLGNIYGTIVSPTAQVSPSFFSISISFIWILILFFFLWIIVMIPVCLLRKDIRRHISLYVYSLVGMWAIGIILLLIGYLVTFLEMGVGDGLKIGTTLIMSMGGIVLYYIMIALFEEYAKYIGAMGMNNTSQYKSLKVFLLIAVSVALGFSCIENILYFYFSAQQSIQGSLISLAFGRSVFSLSVHMCSSMLIAVGFWYLISHRIAFMKKIWIFLMLGLLGIFSHSFFDIALTFEKLGVILLYFVTLYIFIVFISQRDLSAKDVHVAQ